MSELNKNDLNNKEKKDNSFFKVMLVIILILILCLVGYYTKDNTSEVIEEEVVVENESVESEDFLEVENIILDTEETTEVVDLLEEENKEIESYVNAEGYEVLGFTDEGYEIIGYNEFGTPVIGYTPQGYAIIGYTDGIPIVEFAPEESEEKDTSVDLDYPLPYIVNGIDIRTGDYNGDGINDNNGQTWYKGQVWTASNGVVLRIADAYEVGPGQLNNYDCIIRDGTENVEPGSDFANAYDEYLGQTERINVDMSGLPDTELTSSKQTSFDMNNASYLAYKAAFDPLWHHQNQTKNLSGIQVIDSNWDGVMEGMGVIDSRGTLGYMWELRYNTSKDAWVLKVTANYTALLWDSIHNALRLVNPDADAVYDAIYQSMYHGYDGLVVPQYSVGDWVQIGNSQVMLDYSTGVLNFIIK